MTTALTFNEVTLTPVTHQNHLWIRAVDLARALGYKRLDQVAKIYRANADEFTPDMTQVFEILDNAESAFPTKTRIFSPRGCHLIAMFARTPVAKAFRRWVLDVLDKMTLPEEQPQTALPPKLSTPESRKQLRMLVYIWARVAHLPCRDLWPQVNAHLQIACIAELPEHRLPEALAFVQDKINDCQNAPQPQSEIPNGCALPPAPLDAKTYECGKKFFDDLNKFQQHMHTVRERIHLFARPNVRNVYLSEEQVLLYRSANEAANMAVTSLSQALYALRMIYSIRSQVDFMRQ